MQDKHSEQVSGTGSVILQVQFSSEMKRNFARLEAAVHHSKYFGPEVLWILQDLAEGKTMTVQSTILGVAAVIREAGVHIRAVNDEKADEILSSLIDGFSHIREGHDPITITRVQSLSQGWRK